MYFDESVYNHILKKIEKMLEHASDLREAINDIEKREDVPIEVNQDANEAIDRLVDICNLIDETESVIVQLKYGAKSWKSNLLNE